MKEEKELIKKIDNVNHPKHYEGRTSLECIDTMVCMFGIDDTAKFCIMNAYKYLWRYRNKNGLEDLKKAKWYLCKFDEFIENIQTNTFLSVDLEKYIDKAIYLKAILERALEHYEE